MNSLGIALEAYIRANDIHRKLDEELRTLAQRRDAAYLALDPALKNLRPHIDKTQYVTLHGRTFHITISCGEGCYVTEIDIILLKE